MCKLKITPIYGYGWFQNDIPVETPEPFEISIKDYELIEGKMLYKNIIGNIISRNQSIDQKGIFLNIRTLTAPQTYSVRIYDITPIIKFADADRAIPCATGFVELDVQERRKKS